MPRGGRRSMCTTGGRLDVHQIMHAQAKMVSPRLLHYITRTHLKASPLRWSWSTGGGTRPFASAVSPLDNPRGRSRTEIPPAARAGGRSSESGTAELAMADPGANLRTQTGSAQGQTQGSAQVAITHSHAVTQFMDSRTAGEAMPQEVHACRNPHITQTTTSQQ